MLLTLSWLLPVAGALAVLLIGNADGRRDGVIRWLTLAVAIATFVVTVAVWAGFDSASPEFQFVERHPWIPAFGIEYYLGVDGVSLLLVV
ncbi:MAG: NADH-quinone oxidoreductase subunit M, partial [Vicinamibacterales bacterium]